MAYGYVVKFRAEYGQRDSLVALLLQAADVLRENTDCVQYLVSTMNDDVDAVVVTEVWTDQQAHLQGLQDPTAALLVMQARELIAGVEARYELDVQGGWLRVGE